MGEQLPANYSSFVVGSSRGVVADALREDVLAALSQSTLYEFARTQPKARAHSGRGPAWSFSAPLSGENVLVRRTRHGGILAPVTGEFFTGSGRAPHELRASIALRQRGIRTPDVLAYVVYPAALFLSRIDVMLSYVADSRDLATILSEGDEEEHRAGMLAGASLIKEMSKARAVHPDLNLRNILISGKGRDALAWLIDVDRVQLDAHSPEEAERANLRRFGRSFSKLMKLGVIVPNSSNPAQAQHTFVGAAAAIRRKPK